jgi:hypothetical protein
MCAFDERLCPDCYEDNERQLRLAADGNQNTNIITNGAIIAVAISATTLLSDISTDTSDATAARDQAFCNSAGKQRKKQSKRAVATPVAPEALTNLTNSSCVNDNHSDISCQSSGIKQPAANITSVGTNLPATYSEPSCWCRHRSLLHLQKLRR